MKGFDKKMNRYFKRFVSMALVLMMALSCLSTVALAANEAPAAPSITVTQLVEEGYDYAVNFKADTFSDEQSNYYGIWRTDYQVSFNEDVTLNGESGDVILAVHSSTIPDLANWTNVPLTPVALTAGEVFNVMDYIFETLSGNPYDTTFYDVRDAFNNLDIAIAVSSEFKAAHPDLEATVQLYGYDLANPSEYVAYGEPYAFSAPELPTATTSQFFKEDLTFAMNFKADEATAKQLSYYGDWYADFEITINKDVTFDANGTGDGYLAGQYDGSWTDEESGTSWNGQWVYVPFNKPVTLEANKSLKIMAFAAELMGEPGLKYTYKEVYDVVKDFDCGVYFTPEFLKANPDVEVKLELKIYNNEDETESYTIGDTYTFGIPELPTATVDEIVKDDLTFALNFKAVEPTEQQMAFYGNWYADFELTFNKPVTFNANGTADGYLSGQYDFIGPDWLNVPPSDVKLEANKPLKIMAYAAELLEEPGLQFKYSDIISLVKNFQCGVYLEPEFIKNNPDLEITLKLKMYESPDDTQGYVIGETYSFDIDAVAMNMTTGKVYDDVSDALDDAGIEETVVLLKDAVDDLVFVEEGMLDLNGYTLTADYITCFNDIVDNSESNTGVLVVPENKFFIQTYNAQLPIKTAKGYQFVEVVGFNTKMLSPSKYVFQPLFEPAAHDMLANGAAATGISIQVDVTWTSLINGVEGKNSRSFIYNDGFVTQVINSYNPNTGKYSKMFTLVISNPENYDNLTCTAKVVFASGTAKVEFAP